MAEYVGKVLCVAVGGISTIERPGFVPFLVPTTFIGKTVKAFITEIVVSNGAEVANGKDERVGLVISATPAMKTDGSTTIVRGANYPRISPLEICWTKINK